MLVRRRLFLSKDLYERTLEPWDNEPFALLRALMETFVNGGWVSMRFPPSKDVSANLALLCPEEDAVWEMRSRESDPQLRVFGHFAHRNTFVALTWDERPQLSTHEHWEYAIKNCQAQWRKLLPSYRPTKGANPNDFLSEKYSVV
jgi:hypothetical protein